MCTEYIDRCQPEAGLLGEEDLSCNNLQDEKCTKYDAFGFNGGVIVVAVGSVTVVGAFIGLAVWKKQRMG